MSLDPQKMMKMAAQMQADMASAQEALAEERVEATAGGGMVKAIASGNGDSSDRDRARRRRPRRGRAPAGHGARGRQRGLPQAAALQQERMGAITGGLGGLGLPGFCDGALACSPRRSTRW